MYVHTVTYKYKLYVYSVQLYSCRTEQF